ncbi:RNA polymerase factor sigma-54 [Paraferrimonas sp. SM1919]|uniref:RNA polymerase factor sigma-54 n=1 Tax=Paraferrimonas sp. SM1919 TaxID=2662263 RepID=UPI0013D24D3B|nr:RNA polymerase factor sigma-54 [Paraferrimonas sp. SM1919]
MKASLQLKLSQQLTMTPQLQQAIRLLQLSSLELQQEVQEALDANPLLEAEEQLGETKTEETFEASEVDTGEALNSEQVKDDLPLDTQWEESYSAQTSTSASPVHSSEDYVYQGQTVENLEQHLLWQMQLTPFSEVDKAIATAIIDAIDENGYLCQTTEEILSAIGDDDVELDEVVAVLKRIQHFDPIGVAARDLSECLILQLNQLPPDTPALEHAKILIEHHLDTLAAKDFRGLVKKTRLKEHQLKQALELIQTLNPRPGTSLNLSDENYIIPDVTVKKINGRWRVELNSDAIPKLNINQQYAALASSSNKSDSQFIKGHLQEAKWFIKSLESRHDTLMKVSNCIVQYQQGFFEYGAEAMKPMVLNDIAEALDLHESTISRVTTQKYMHTPKGIFELKYFFSSHVATDDGGECSSTAIRAIIKKLVAAENPKKPLSDNKITELLAEQGIKVARRTIAKYRDVLQIPPSNQRKML